MSEKEYIKYFNENEYYKEIILLIIKNIFEKSENKNRNDALLINDLIKRCGDIINKYKEKFKDEMIKKLFPLLDKKFDNFNKTNKLGNKQKGNNFNFNNSLLNKKSFYEQSSKNAINTTVILDNFKNVVFNTNRNNKSKGNLNINNSSLNNLQLNSINNASFTNRNPILFNNNISFLKNKNNLSNNNFNNNFNRTFIKQNPQTFRENNRNQNDSNTFINIMSKDIKKDDINININNDLKNNEEKKEININLKNNVNLELNNIQILNEDIKQNLSQENNEIYNKIHNFFNKEYSSLSKRMNDLNITNYINDQLNSLRESNQLRKYRNIFSNIYEKEKKKSEDISKNIFQSKNNLDKMRKECNSLFIQINSGLVKPNLINENFRNIMEDINEYEYNNKKIDYINNDNNFNQLRKSSSMDNKINKKYNNRYNLYKSKIPEENKEDDNDDFNYSSFPVFCNSYDPFYLSEKINSNFTHNFFNYKKNYSDLKFKLMSAKLI